MQSNTRLCIPISLNLPAHLQALLHRVVAPIVHDPHSQLDSRVVQVQCALHCGPVQVPGLLVPGQEDVH